MAPMTCKGIFLYILTLLLGITGFCAADTHADLPDQAVNTTSGVFAAWYPQGFTNISVYPNVQYGKSPMGDLRWAPPIPAERVPGVVKETDWPPGCFQLVQKTMDDTVTVVKETDFLLRSGDYSGTSEDCLRLGIIVPKDAVPEQNGSTHPQKELLPVVVFFHGGGLSFGGVDVPYQIGLPWVSRSREHIIVSVDYRLNMLDSPNALGLAAEGNNINFGLLDQRLAMEWVRDNIAMFGGDPSRIAMWGQSYGAIAVDYYNFAYVHDPIAASIILDSGSAFLAPPMGGTVSPSSNWTYAVNQLGCGEKSPADELACMRNVSSSEMQNFLQGKAGEQNLLFNPVVDNRTFFGNYTERILAENFSKVPAILGTNNNEGVLFVPYVDGPTLPPSSVEEASLITQTALCGTIRYTSLRSQLDALSYRYYYSGNFTDISPEPWLGAYHCSELPLLFGTYNAQDPNDSTTFERKMSEHMQDLYLAFLKNPQKGPEQVGWKPATATDPVLHWAANDTLQSLLDISSQIAQCQKEGLL